MQEIRTLELDGKPTVTVRMSAPAQEDGEWVCHWQIDGLDVPTDSLRCVGSDPMETIIFALATIGSTIEASPDAEHLTYLDHPALRLLTLDSSKSEALIVTGDFPTFTP